MKRHIPNLLTLANAACGFVGIVCAFEGKLALASYCIFVACLFDFADGFAARLLRVQSAIGKELDSLSDAISFGLLPAVICYQLLGMGFLAESLWRWGAVLLLLFSVLRLAKFNTDTRQQEGFIGLPTPANALLWASLPLMLLRKPAWEIWLTQPMVLLSLCVFMSFLLVAELPLFALKFKNFRWQDNQIKFIFLILSVALVLWASWLALPLIIFLYVFLSLIYNSSKQ